jgi:hypothetical protein
MENTTMKFRKSFVALKLVFGGNEQALVLVDLLESYAYRCSDEWIQIYGEEGVSEDGFLAKSRALITEDTGILTASVKTAIDSLVKQGFILETSDRYLQQYSKKVIHYKICLDTLPYLKKASDYLYNKSHRPDDKNAVKKILLPFINKLTFHDNIIEALGVGSKSIREAWKEKEKINKSF